MSRYLRTETEIARCPTHGDVTHGVQVFKARAGERRSRPKCRRCASEAMRKGYIPKLPPVVMNCPKHGWTPFSDYGTRKQCRRCAAEAVSATRTTRKDKLIASRGGKCERCGYDRTSHALEFHHRDPATKSFPLSKASRETWENLRAEARKCVLLCANCHRELHAGLWNLV